MIEPYKSKSHCKFLLQYHLVLVCKYKKKLLAYENIANDIKSLSLEICGRHDVTIHYMKADNDHTHYMIETPPNLNLSDFVRTLKSYTTYHL